MFWALRADWEAVKAVEVVQVQQDAVQAVEASLEAGHHHPPHLREMAVLEVMERTSQSQGKLERVLVAWKVRKRAQNCAYQ